MKKQSIKMLLENDAIENKSEKCVKPVEEIYKFSINVLIENTILQPTNDGIFGQVILSTENSTKIAVPLLSPQKICNFLKALEVNTWETLKGSYARAILEYKTVDGPKRLAYVSHILKDTVLNQFEVESASL